jgi:hypothetical protein
MPPNQEPESMKHAVKIFADTVNMRIIDGLLNLNLQSGNQAWTFLFHAATAKKIAKAIVQQIEEIEKKMGVKFDDRLPHEPMLSPMSFGQEPPLPGKKE